MSSFVLGVAPIFFGLVAIFARREAARFSLEWDYRILGASFDEKWHQASFVVTGIVFILIGILVSSGMLLLPT